MGRPRKYPRRWYRATDTFAFVDPDTGLHYNFHRGDLLPEGALLEKCRMYFEALDEDYPGPVEQATAAPGQRRGDER